MVFEIIEASTLPMTAKAPLHRKTCTGLSWHLMSPSLALNVWEVFLYSGLRITQGMEVSRFKVWCCRAWGLKNSGMRLKALGFGFRPLELR